MVAKAAAMGIRLFRLRCMAYSPMFPRQPRGRLTHNPRRCAGVRAAAYRASTSQRAAAAKRPKCERNVPANAPTMTPTNIHVHGSRIALLSASASAVDLVHRVSYPIAPPVQIGVQLRHFPSHGGDAKMADYILQYDREKLREVTEAPREAGSTAPSPERQIAARQEPEEQSEQTPEVAHESVSQIAPRLIFQTGHPNAFKRGSFGCVEPVNLQ